MPEVNSVKIFQTPSLSFEEKQQRIEELRAMIEGSFNVILIVAFFFCFSYDVINYYKIQLKKTSHTQKFNSSTFKPT
jgi:hypothetical protein